MDSLGSEEEVKKPLKEVPVVQDEGVFAHATGDTYEGFFEAKKKDRSVKMHGLGVYTTAEGDQYSGNWDADKLGGNTEVKISYCDGATYQGLFSNFNYAGKGRYYYPDGSILICDFSESCPGGNLTLIDPNAHVWLGKAVFKNGFGWFEPVNHFYETLEKPRESPKKRRKTDVGAVSKK